MLCMQFICFEMQNFVCEMQKRLKKKLRYMKFIFSLTLDQSVELGIKKFLGKGTG